VWLAKRWGARRKPELLLHLGRHRLVWWWPEEGGWRLLGQDDLAEGAAVAHVAELVARQFAAHPSARITLLLDSYWMPNMLLPLAGHALSRAAVESWAQGRLADLYGGVQGGHLVQTRYVKGESHAWVAGCARPLLDALRSGLAGAPHQILPSLGWAWGQAMRHPNLPKAGVWLVWAEQDRSLWAQLRQGRMVALNPAGAKVASVNDLAAGAGVAAARAGSVLANEPIVGLSLAPGVTQNLLAANGATIRWCPLGRAISEGAKHAA
jgi:hypothetical protein